MIFCLQGAAAVEVGGWQAGRQGVWRDYLRPLAAQQRTNRSQAAHETVNLALKSMDQLSIKLNVPSRHILVVIKGEGFS